MKKIILFSLCLLFASTVALADLVDVESSADPLQDDWVLGGPVEELSTAPHSDDQLISSSWQTTEFIPCPTDYLGGTNFEVTITNLTDRYFEDLYYVGDVAGDGSLETTFTNLDEWVADVSPWHALNVPGMAFKIDSIGLNTPLIFESMTQDDIFEPGEVWKFVIQEFSNTLSNSAAALGSIGPTPYGAIAQASGGDSISSGSIITPEPATLCLFGLGGLLLRRRKKT